jgi:cell division protein FtsA
MADKIICGLDIGNYKIAAIVAVKKSDSDELRIIGFNSAPSRGVKRGLIVDIDQVTAAVDDCIGKAERMAGHKITSAFVSVGGPHISSLNSHGVVAVSNQQGEIAEDDVERVVDSARAISLSTMRKIIEVSPREYIVDGQSGIKNPIGMSGVRLEVDTHIITASTTNLKNIDRCLEHLGIGNDGFIFSGLAAAEAVLTDTEKELGVVLADIGGGKIDICLYTEGALSYSSSIPVGARHVTNDIAVGLRVSLESAERIKLHLSRVLASKRERTAKRGENVDLRELNLPENISEISVKTLLEGIMQPRIEEIYKLVGEEIAKSEFADQVPSGIVITGGGALTVGMVESGRRIVGLPIRVGLPDRVTGLLDEVVSPQYAATCGLILYGRQNIMEQDLGFKKFNKVLKDFSMTQVTSKIKNFFKQFIP